MNIISFIVSDKVFLSKINFNIYLFAATPLDFKESVLKKFNYKYSIDNLIAFTINISNIIEFRIRYCCYAHCLSLFLT